MAHPLSGANLRTLVSAVQAGGWPDKWGTMAAIGCASLARMPASEIERALIAKGLPTVDELPPPIFILGHWRSGTTHLYNLLSHGEFSYVSPISVGLPWDMFGIGRIFRPLLERALPEHRWIDRIPVTPTSPQEDEIGIASMTSVSFYHGIYFPKVFDRLIDRGLFFDGCSAAEIQEWETRFTYFLRKIAHQQGKPLLIKNPVYTARVTLLKRLFPDAKFIFLHRNPFDVVLSMRNFYRRLLDVMALQDVPADLDIDATILRVYDRMAEAYRTDSEQLEAGDLIELAYSELDSDPLNTLQRIYSHLNLEGFDVARPAFSSYIDSVRAFKKNEFKGDEATIDLVQTHLGRWIEHYKYTTPAPRSNACA